MSDKREWIEIFRSPISGGRIVASLEVDDEGYRMEARVEFPVVENLACLPENICHASIVIGGQEVEEYWGTVVGEWRVGKAVVEGKLPEAVWGAWRELQVLDESLLERRGRDDTVIGEREALRCSVERLGVPGTQEGLERLIGKKKDEGAGSRGERETLEAYED